MAVTMKELGIGRLSPEDRIALALEIWESLGEDQPSEPIIQADRAELLPRDADLEANPSIALTWEQIRSSIGKTP